MPRARRAATPPEPGGPGDTTLASRIAELEARLRTAERERETATAREAGLQGLADTAQRAQAEFLALVSHELRTPLNAITGYVDLLRLHVRGPLSAEQQSDLDHVARNAHQLLGVVTDLLNLTRVSRAEITPRLETVPVRELLEAIDSVGERQAAGKRLAYDRIDCAASTAVHADRALTQQVMQNLLSNAFKFTAAPGTVTRTCDADDAVVRVGVRDTGRGIPPQGLTAIFGPFVQIDPGELPERRRGIGVGLAIARELARLMGGDIGVESEVGVGSTFTLVLPRAPA